MSLSARLLDISSRISQIPLSHYSTQLSSLLPNTSFSAHVHQISKLTILVLTITSVFYFTFISLHFSSSSYRTFALTTSGRKGAFVDSLSATDINGPYDNSTLVELCRSRKWRKGLIFRCQAPSTEMVESRNVMLNCLRFGIEAGATHFILPVLKAPEDKDPDESLPFNHLFDLDHFTSTLTASCPQISLIPHINDLWDKPSTAPPVLLSPNSLHAMEPQLPLIHSTLLANPGNWSSAFKKSLNASHPRAPTEKLPVLVALSPPPLLQFPTNYDPAPLITNFGKLIRPSPDLRRLAAAILYALSQKHNLNLLPTPGIQRDTFFGAVLSSPKQSEEAKEADPNEARTSTTSKGKPDLSTSLLTAASSSNLESIYLATPHNSPGTIAHFRSTGAIEAFTTLALNLSIALETAESLLGGSVPTTYVPEEGEVAVVARQGVQGFEAEWNTYKTLTAAQKEVLDFEVLSRASLFGGNWENSLSWGVALKRHVIASGGGGKWVGVSGSDIGAGKPSPKVKPPPPFPSPKSPEKRALEEEVGTEVEGENLEKRPVIDLAADKAAVAASPIDTPTPRIRTITTPGPRPTRSAARTNPTGTKKPKPRPKSGPRPRPTRTSTSPSTSTSNSKPNPKGKGTTKGKVGTGAAGGKDKGKGKSTVTIKGETCFRDEFSVIYGPRGEGKGWVLGGWP